MDREWNDSQPIYRQLRDRVVAMVLDGLLSEGDSLPSVRTVAVEYRVNPLTVLKSYQQLVDEQLVESRRGRGMSARRGGAFRRADRRCSIAPLRQSHFSMAAASARRKISSRWSCPSLPIASW